MNYATVLDYSPETIKRLANESHTLTNLATKLHYSKPRNVGSNSMRRLKSIIGVRSYKNLVSGKRKNTSRNKWVFAKRG